MILSEDETKVYTLSIFFINMHVLFFRAHSVVTKFFAELQVKIANTMAKRYFLALTFACFK